MTPSSYVDRIAALDACGPAVDWLRESQHPDLASAWAVCPRGDWMLWLAGRMAGPPGSDSRRPLVLAACACARTALHVYEERFPGDPRPRRAIEAAEAWARGEATLDDVQVAAKGALLAACDTDASDAHAASAAIAAATSAYADTDADKAASAADAAADAAYAASVADTSDSADIADRARALAEMADLVREHYPAPPITEAP